MAPPRTALLRDAPHARLTRLLLSGVCHIAVEQGRLDFAWVAWTDPEATRLEPAAEAFTPTGFVDQCVREFDQFASLRNVVRERLALQIPVFVNDVRADPIVDVRRGEYERAGVRSAAAIPIVLDGKLVALLFVYSAKAGCFAQEERALLEAIAADGGLALAKLESRAMDDLAAQELRDELIAFSYSVSHDLRAPLRAIEGFSGLLEERIAGRLDAEESGFLQRIRRAVERMTSQIDGILHLARLSTQPFQRSRLDVSGMARDIALGLQREAPERAVSWHIEDNLTAQADAVLVRALLKNLLGNAWKFTSKKADARIDVGADAAQAALYVRDNGAGFDMAFSDRLFDAFHRMHPESEFPGNGIGLATVKRIVSRHSGRVWAEARPQEGATFYFTLGSM